MKDVFPFHFSENDAVGFVMNSPREFTRKFEITKEFMVMKNHELPV
jgi:hypothetical protein